MNALRKHLTNEELLINTFQGRVLTPQGIRNLKHYQLLFTESEKRTIEAKLEKVDPEGSGSCKSPSGSLEQKGVTGNMLQDIGFLKMKEEKENGTVFDLEIKLPFHPKEKFYVMKPKLKENDSQPDYLIFDNSCRVGSIWNPRPGKKAMSGEIFALGVSSFNNTKTNDEKPFMRFIIMEKENQKKEKHQIVCFSYGRENWNGVTQEEQPEPF